MKNNHSQYRIKNWCIDQALIYPKRTIVLTILLTIFMASGIRFLIIDDDMMKMLPKHLESRSTWEAVQNEFGSTEIIFIGFGNEGKSVYNSRSLADLWVLSNGLKNLSTVEKVSNITTSYRIDYVDGFMEIEDLQKSQNLEHEDVELSLIHI